MLVSRAIPSGCATSLLAIVLILNAFGFGKTSSQNRISRPIHDDARTTVHGSASPLLKLAIDHGTVSSDVQFNRVTMVFRETREQSKELDRLLREQQRPGSANYHAWLTPEEFGERFGISRADIARVAAWLRSHSIAITEISPSRTAVTFSGTAGQIASAMGTSIHRYTVRGRTHYANAGDVQIPSELADVVLAIQNLDNFGLRARGNAVKSARANFTSGVTDRHFLTPDDVAIIYNAKPLHASGITGRGQKITVVGQTDVQLSDLQSFRSASGLPASKPQVILVPGSHDPGIVSEDIIEANLDLQWAGALAPDAQIIYVNSGNGVLDSLHYAVDHNLAPVISISYGNCEQNFSASMTASLLALTKRANAQGQTIVAASGDRGATDCEFDSVSARKGLAVDVPASLPTVTAIGGTRFREDVETYWDSSNSSSGSSARSYIPEVVWNDSAESIAGGAGMASSGGGISTRFSKPEWQGGADVPQGSMRMVPDVSLSASGMHDPYLICSQGNCVKGFRSANDMLMTVGGTSAGAPVFAGLIALLNQMTGEAQGNANPELYSLAARAPEGFHDVVHGNNDSPCAMNSLDCPSGMTTIGYGATSGYDLATGLGSIDVHKLASAWTALHTISDFELRTPQASIATSGSAAVNAAITVAALGSFDSTVELTCIVSDSLRGTKCTLLPARLAANGTSMLVITPASRSVTQASSRSILLWSLSACLAIGGILIPTSGRVSRKGAGVATSISLLLALAMFGCGTGKGGPAGSSSGTSTLSSGMVTVHATSGTIKHSVTIALTISQSQD